MGLKFVQQQKNCTHHAGINRTPYKAMFGEDPKVGLTSSSLPPEILERLQSKDDLLALYQAPPPDTTAVHNNELSPTTNEQLPPSPPATSQSFTSSQALSGQHHHNPSPLNSTLLDKRLEDIANQ